jgi:dTDP-4-dehydrorhamnose reductase
MTGEAFRTLVLGARGLVGGALLECLPAGPTNGADLEARPGCEFALNIRDVVDNPASLRELIRRTKPAVIINAAGMTHVELCEADEEDALLVNAAAAEVIAKEASDYGARTLYYSTEYVFDGTNGPYGETDGTRPLSAYGRSKLAGEVAVLAADSSALVVRTTVVYGPEEKGKNFAYQLAAGLLNGRSMHVPTDQISSPTYSRDLARGTILLLQLGVKGIVNVAGPEVMSRLELAERIGRRIGASHHLVQGVQTVELRQVALRPKNAGLRIDKLQQLLPGFMPNAPEQAVDHWLRNQRFKSWP